MDHDFRAVLEAIANAVGDVQSDIGTDHGRWQLYERAMTSPTGLELLRRAVALEEDRSLAASVVLRMLEQVTDDRQDDWITQLAPDNREYCQRRAVEIRTLRRAREGGLPVSEIAANLQGWTDWLQSRLAAALVDREALAILSINGRTKRIRNAATARLKAFSG